MPTKSAQAKVKKDQNRAQRIEQISEKLARHDLRQRKEVKNRAHKLTRKIRKRPGEMLDMIAYDLETTNIKEGTPKPLYITAFADHHNFILSREVNGIGQLLEVLEEQFLTPEFNKCQFVAWNANNFDVYFVSLALMLSGRYLLRPYLTKNKALRGVRVIPIEDLELKPKQQRAWEFLDGISMLGLVGTSLKLFLERFAPDHEKHERESFDHKEFDAKDPDDVAYALQDSIGLYWGMQRAQEIVFERFNMGLRPTIGNLGIKLFETRIPEETIIVEPPLPLLDLLRAYICRGGYCHLMRKYKGPVWKYDLNQAYAAAMRECALPAGNAYYMRGAPKHAKIYAARITATNTKNIVPFYCRETDPRGTVVSFAKTKIVDSWVTSVEIEQLRREGWNLIIHESWAWPESFTMGEYVNALEHLRMNAPGGPSGAVGTMIKAIGNNSYGKTLEQLEPLELVLAAECPEGFSDYYGGEESADAVPYVWCRFIETPAKKYHQPQIGAFITAHARMVIRRAALLAPEHFLYADTDCVIFSTDVTSQLDIDARRYGAFKLEASGEEYRLIAKKVYMSEDFTTKHSKGLNVKRLEYEDFVKWFSGDVPTQTQVQRQNFMRVIKGGAMFVKRTRRGTAI